MTLTSNELDAEHPELPDSFTELGVSDDLVEVLASQGITSPFPIQAMAIPDALNGRDVLGKAKTGSGKTLAFGLPMIEKLEEAAPTRPRGLVIVPTRELAAQVTEALEPLAQARGGSVTSVYGGAPMGAQIKRLERGTEIVVATPGRLIDLLERKVIHLDQVDTLVVDEADEMADMGFLPQVQMILRQVTSDPQTMLFSATLDHRVEILVRNYMDDPVSHSVASETVTVETSNHRFLEVHHMDKPKVAARIIRNNDRVLVFCQTKRNCDRVASDLRDLGLEARAIHGDLHQRQREKVLAGFARGKAPVLVATNVAARGLDIEGVDVVIHYDAPDDATTYLHRSGRTARAGEDGLVVTFVEWDELDRMRRIQKEAGLTEGIVKMFSNDDRLDDLVAWDPPEREEPESAEQVRRRRSRRRPRNRI